MKKNLLKIRFVGAGQADGNFWKQILRIQACEWDETPYLLTITLLGFYFDFEIGKWVEDDL